MFRTLHRGFRADGVDRAVLIGVLLWVTTIACPLLTGCQSAAIRQQIQDAQAAKLKADAKAAAVASNAKRAPVQHPVTSTNQSVAKLRASATTITIVAGVLFAISVGLLFTPLSLTSKITVPILGSVTALSFLSVIALPFLPWVLLAVAVLAVSLFAYEVIRHKSLRGGTNAIESFVGLHLNTSTLEEAYKQAHDQLEAIANANTKAATPSVAIPSHLG